MLLHRLRSQRLSLVLLLQTQQSVLPVMTTRHRLHSIRCLLLLLLLRLPKPQLKPWPLSQLWPLPQVPPLRPPLRLVLLQVPRLALPPAQLVPVRPRVLAVVGLQVDPVVVLAVAQELLLHQ